MSGDRNVCGRFFFVFVFVFANRFWRTGFLKIAPSASWVHTSNFFKKLKRVLVFLHWADVQIFWDVHCSWFLAEGLYPYVMDTSYLKSFCNCSTAASSAGAWGLSSASSVHLRSSSRGVLTMFLALFVKLVGIKWDSSPVRCGYS